MEMSILSSLAKFLVKSWDSLQLHSNPLLCPSSAKDWSPPKLCVLGSTQYEVADVIAIRKNLSQFRKHRSIIKLKMPTCFQPILSLHHYSMLQPHISQNAVAFFSLFFKAEFY